MVKSEPRRDAESPLLKSEPETHAISENPSPRPTRSENPSPRLSAVKNRARDLRDEETTNPSRWNEEL